MVLGLDPISGTMGKEQLLLLLHKLLRFFHWYCKKGLYVHIICPTNSHFHRYFLIRGLKYRNRIVSAKGPVNTVDFYPVLGFFCFYSF